MSPSPDTTSAAAYPFEQAVRCAERNERQMRLTTATTGAAYSLDRKAKQKKTGSSLISRLIQRWQKAC
jgi:hypothetical protein